MNSTLNNLPPLLDFLQGLMPPSHIALVGAGNGKTPWAQWLNAQTVPATLVEADDQQFVTLQRQQAAGSWAQARLLHAVVAAEAGEVAFYTSSLAAESGLLPAEAMQQLWPNMHPLHASQRQAIGLADVLPLQHPNQWLVLDCLPAAALVKDAASALAQVDVVVARVLLTSNHAHLIPGTGLAELVDLLTDFVQLTLQAPRPPPRAEAVFVRDYRRATTQALKAQMAEQESKQAAIQRQKVLQAQLEQEQHRNADLLKKQELQAQVQQALQADLIQTAQARDAEAKVKQATQQEHADLQAHVMQSLDKNHKQLEKTVKQEILNATQQLEAFLNIQSFFIHGEHQPIMHGWSISPDLRSTSSGCWKKMTTT